MSMNDVLQATFADFLINIAAGWFGAAVILPIRTERRKIKFLLLIVNIICCMVSLLFAYMIRGGL